MKTEPAILQTLNWLQNIVIGLNLCPFAKAPYNKDQIRFITCDADKEEGINQCLITECELLDSNSGVETTLIICTKALSDFFDYTQFLQWAEQTLKNNGWRGIYQIASFHPDYVFANTDSDDLQNLSNRSPYPILHILREESLSKVIDKHQNTEEIPAINIETIMNLSEDEKRRLFSYLY